MDLIDKRDEVLRTFLEYGITECDWCDLRKKDLADCAESIVEKLTIPVFGSRLDCSNCKYGMQPNEKEPCNTCNEFYDKHVSR